MQDSRKIKLCDTVVDLDYFERLVKMYAQGNAAEVISYSSPGLADDQVPRSSDKNAIINSSVAIDDTFENKDKKE